MGMYGVQFTAYYRAWDTSANTGKTGDSGNHTLYWTKDGTASATSNSPAEVDGTHLPGVYKIVITATEAQCLAGHIGGKSSTSNIVIIGTIYDFVYLPNVAAGTTGGLPLAVDSSGRVDVLKINGTSQTARDIGASVLLSSGAGTGQLDFTSGVVKANVTQFGGSNATASSGIPEVKVNNIAAAAITAASIASDADTEIAGAVWDLATTGHTTSGSFGEAANAAGSAGDPWTTALPGAYSSGQAGYILGTNLDTPVSDAAVAGDAMTLTSAYDFAKGSVAMTEAYASDGAAPTPVQALYEILQFLEERSISGTTMTIKKRNGSTTAMTFTINDATNPTSQTRAT